jgi:hypothetical protein
VTFHLFMPATVAANTRGDAEKSAADDTATMAGSSDWNISTAMTALLSVTAPDHIIRACVHASTHARVSKRLHTTTVPQCFPNRATATPAASSDAGCRTTPQHAPKCA